MSKNYNKRHPQQARAKWLVQKKVQRGEIKKPPCCQMCKANMPPSKLQAHHHNYAQPLNVSWYCSKCHTALHKELGRDWK